MNSYSPTATAMRSVHASFIGRTGWFSKFPFSMLPLIALLFVSGGVWGQATNWSAPGDGIWTEPTNWSGGVPVAGSIVTINSSVTITDVPTLTISKLKIEGAGTVVTLKPFAGGNRTLRVNSPTNDAIVVDAGATLIISGLDDAIPRILTLSTTNTIGLEANIYGTIAVTTDNAVAGAYGAFTKATNATIHIRDGGIYVHGRNGGAVPTATWDPASTCEVTGVVNITVTGTSLNQTFGNFVWNCAGQTSILNIGTATGTMAIAGNLEILDTGTERVHLNQLTLTVTGDFIQSGGTVRLVNTTNPRTLNVGGNFELSGATTLFIVTNGAGAAALNIDGNFTQADGTFDQRAANTTSTSVVTVGGDFNLNGGIYDISGVNAVGYLNVAGNFSHIGGTLTETAGGIGNGVITFNGSALQTFTTTGWGALDRINFVLDNSGDGVQLNSPLTVNANAGFTFTDGILTTDATNLLSFRAGATVSGVSNASHVNGPVEKTGTTAFVFPVGNGTRYKPVGLSAPSMPVASNTFRVTYFDSAPSGDPDMTTLMEISGSEYWDVNRTVGTSSVSVTLNWAGNDMAEDEDLMGLRVAHFIGGLWVSAGGTTMDMDPMAGGMIASNLVGSFSPFTLGSSVANNALPIELLAFTATPKDKTVQLNWRTATELNNAYFQIERSTNGRDFEKIGKVAGAGTSHAPLDYAFTDQLPKTGWNYYRLKQVDFDGQFSYSPVQAVQMGKDGSIRLQVFPNPANDELNLKTDRLIEPADRLEIYDYTGRQVMSFSAADAVNAPVVISQLPAGTYMLRLRTAEGISSAAFVKQ